MTASSSSSEQVQRLLASLRGYNSTPADSNNNHTEQSQANASSSSHSSQPTSFSSTLPGLGGLTPEQYVFTSTTPTPSTPAPSQSHQAHTSTSISTSIDPRLARRPTSRTPTPHQQPQPSINQATQSRPPPKPIPDASTITTWPTAIAHVMTHLLPNADFAARIRRLINTQHQYERDWADKRALITARHASRDTSAAQLQSIFASLGVPVPAPLPSPVSGSGGQGGKEGATAATTVTPSLGFGAGGNGPGRDLEAESRELAEYDAKVYKQLLALVGDFDRQLRGLGVPFYAIRHDLVVLENGKGAVGGMDKSVRKLDRGELRELQRRMLEWLEMSFPVE